MPPSFFELPVNNSRQAIVDNIRINARRGLPELKQSEWNAIPLMIVAGGPSLHEFLPIIRAYKPDCHILAVNGAYKFLRAQGIEPEHFILIDSRADNVTHVDSPYEETNHCLASQVHPDVFEALRDHQVTMFHLGTATALEAAPGRSYLTAPIGMASVHAIYVGAALGYRTQFLFGYDFSRSSQSSYAFPQPLNDTDEFLDITLAGKTYRTTLALARTAQQFVQAISPVMRACELNVQMYSDGLLSAMLQVVQSEANEREKYEGIWKVDSYRRISPGLASVEQALDLLKMPQGSSIADFGCGTGRCVKWFQDNGYRAVGVDIAGNCLEEDVPFVQAALWDAAKLPAVDYGFSTDVLEHIPTDHVLDVLKAIHSSVSVACYLNIDTIPDAFGVQIGQHLHLTVMPAAEWLQVLSTVWRDVQCIGHDERQAIFVCRK